jgi:hypothetical protein
MTDNPCQAEHPMSYSSSKRVYWHLIHGVTEKVVWRVFLYNCREYNTKKEQSGIFGL